MSPATGPRNLPYAPRLRAIEDRRSRGEAACAECRRLKLKCSRTIPCSSCVKRDCAELCPNASNVTKDTTRTVIAASQHLHDEIGRLRRRARALESALGTLHLEREGAAHPLLSQDNDFGDDESAGVDVDRTASDGAVLHLSQADGMQGFFGNVPLPQGAASVANPGELAQLPAVLDHCIRAFPFPMPSATRELAVEALRWCLPDRTYVERILNSLFEEYMFMVPAVDKTFIFVELLPGLYNPALALPPSGDHDREAGDSPRAYALIYTLLAHGVLMDIEDSARESRAAVFSRLCLAGLGAVSIFDKPSYTSVLALFFHSTYHMWLQRELGDTARCFNNLAFQCAIQIGLYVDPGRWKLPWVTVQRRRRLFWVLFQVNLWECIATGRPPIIYDPLLIDCTFPLDMDTEHEPGGPKLAPESNSFMRTRDLVSRVVVLTTVIEPPQYRDILALDATIRAEWTPPSKQSRLGAEISMLRRAIFVGPYRALVLMSLHRGHFVQAIAACPLDPTESVYNTSFQSCVCAAWDILGWMPMFFEADPNKAVYMLPPAWTWALTAAMILYTVIEKAPYSACVLDILNQLDSVRAVFAAAKDLPGGARAASGWPTLQGLCTTSRAIIANRDTRSDRVAWNIEPSKAWEPEPQASHPRSTLEHNTASAPPAFAHYRWLEDDVSDSFKSLFKQHYHDTQRYNVPNTTPDSTPPPSPLSSASAAMLYSYPGYLQHSSERATKPKRTRDRVPALIRMSELLPDASPAMGPQQAFELPLNDVKLPPDSSSLTGIWLAHSHQLNIIPLASDVSSTGSSPESSANYHHVLDYSRWY